MKDDRWEKFQRSFFYESGLNLMLDYSKMDMDDEYFRFMSAKIRTMFEHNRKIEAGEKANSDECRMVGHYWLRDPERAPNDQIKSEIIESIVKTKGFANKVHSGKITGEKGTPFKNVLVIGIGGSSLGTRFIYYAMQGRGKLKLFFLDNTDPDGMDAVFQQIKDELAETLVLVISKSGATIETHNGMEEVRHLFQNHGLHFPAHAVCISQSGSKLEFLAREERWLDVFPMWEWVGGRTSVLSPVGLLPLALYGIDIDQLLAGARECDRLTRREDVKNNPAALLALGWYSFTKGSGDKNMVILPYKDRLSLLTQYLQQLIMESLGKGTDQEGNPVYQGITVFGNKGSTDQHSYLQQLLDGPDNFFVIFIEILKGRREPSPLIRDRSTSGDYLHAFLHGTREALTQRGKRSMTITIPDVNEFYLGVLIALFERAVTFYASMINVNAYNQPAVELSKKSAAQVIHLKNSTLAYLNRNKGKKMTVEEVGEGLKGFAENEVNEVNKELLFKILLHLAANEENGVKIEREDNILESRYWID